MINYQEEQGVDSQKRKEDLWCRRRRCDRFCEVRKYNRPSVQIDFQINMKRTQSGLKPKIERENIYFNCFNSDVIFQVTG